MLLQRFLEAIDRGWIGRYVARKQEIIEKTDPKRFYVENVRQFFGLRYSTAKFLCKVAARQGAFIEKIGYICPNEGRMMRSYRSDAKVDETIVCKVCELNGEDRFEFDVNELEKITFYEVKD